MKSEECESLCKIVSEHDAMADSGKTAEEIVSLYYDMDSVAYVAMQRGIRASQRFKIASMIKPDVAYASLWIDGFIAGMKCKGEENEKVQEQTK